jgi:hypothetical protein
MTVNGRDCFIVIKTAHQEIDVPYADETIREAVSFLQEEASIEGDGVCRGLRKSGGVTGCVVAPFTTGTAPLLLYLAMGSAGSPAFISETRNLYKHSLELLPMEDTEHFDLIQDRQMRNERKLYENCRVKSFELRIMRGEAIKLKLEICGERPPSVYLYTDTFVKASGERFSGDYVIYWINDREYKNIYGITLVSKKEGGTKTEIWIKRALEQGPDLPAIIEEMTITAQLLRDTYEQRQYGTFKITLKKLVPVSDETEINTSGAVIGPLRYYMAGTVSTEVFTSSGEPIA